MTTPRVAIDVGSLHGPQTGVGQFVTRLLDGLAGLDEPPDVLPYVLSFRAELRPGVRRLRYPATAALRAWGRSTGLGRPSARRQPGRLDRTIVPPAHPPSCRCTTAGSCSAPPRSRKRWHFGAVLQRAVAQGDGPRALSTRDRSGARSALSGGVVRWAHRLAPTGGPSAPRRPRRPPVRAGDRRQGAAQEPAPPDRRVRAAAAPAAGAGPRAPRTGRSRRPGHRRRHQPSASRRRGPHPARRLRE